VIVAYTAIFGGSDSPKLAPPADLAVMFTDSHETWDAAAAKGWTVIGRESVGDRARREARTLKMTPQELFPDADAWVWVDGSIEIKDWSSLMRDTQYASVACLEHPDRASCYDEGKTVVRLQIAHHAKIMAALDLYQRDGFIPSTLSTTGLLFRRHTPAVIEFNKLWRDHLDAYGTNDQVHVDYCAWKTGVPIKYLEGHYRANPYATYDKADHHKRRKPQFKLEAECDHYLA
jgi:alkaline ceramidase TOD1/glycosyltransferase MUCI70-like protein